MIIAISCIFGYSVTVKLIPMVGRHLLDKTSLHGIDMGKKDKPKLPESLGIVVGLTYLASFLLFLIVAPYVITITEKFCISPPTIDPVTNGYSNSLSNIAAITSITAMLILGFIDDCYDLKWRYKLMFPFAASIPLLSVYYYSYRDRTTILVPYLIAKYLNLDEQLNLGVFYYIFMLMFVIFCTNAINIYSGINGLEVGQAIVLSVTMIFYNLIEIATKSTCDEVHTFSLQLLLPFLFCSCALYKFNRYPAKVFVGDSYCYFAGMTLAVVGILGHFSEEILLFAIPQVINFILSIPQLFKFVPCPRHRLPKFNEETGLREPSTFTFRYRDLNIIGRLLMKIYSTVGFAVVTRHPPEQGDEGPKVEEERPSQTRSPLILDDHYTSNNLTLINLWLCWSGPKSERDLCRELLRFQGWLSFTVLAFLTLKVHNE